MTKYEYNLIQSSLNNLLNDEKKRNLRLNSSEWEAYKLAVNACKSVVSKCNIKD